MDLSSELKDFATFALAILIMIAIGFAAKRTRMLEISHAEILNRIIINLTLPAFIFSFTKASKIEPSLFKIPVLAIAVMLLCAALAFLVGRILKLKPKIYGAFMLAAMAGNTGYLGFPLTQAIFGDGHVVKAVLYDLFGTVLMIFTLGLLIARNFGTDKKEKSGLADILRFPPLLAFVLAIMLSDVSLPESISMTIGFLGQATVPLIMLSIGLSLDPGHAARYKGPLAATFVIKLIAAPILALGIASILKMDSLSASVSLLEAAMPTALITSVFGRFYDLDNDFLPAAIITTTLASLITVPVIMTVLL